MSPDYRILIVNQNWMGDVLFSTPAIRALRKKFPDARISCMAPKRTAEILRHNPYLDDFFIYHERAGFLSLLGSFRVFWWLLRNRFNRVYFFHASRSKVFLCFLAGIRERIGFKKKKGLFLTFPIEMPDARQTHKIDAFLYMLNQSGVSSDGRVPDFRTTADESRLTSLKLLDGRGVLIEKYIVIHPGGNWLLKRWPLNKFRRLIELYLTRTSLNIVICGAASESVLAEQLLKDCGSDRIISLSGQTTLGELAVLLKNAQFVISNDSGPIHLASSQGAKIVGIYGPTSDVLTGPVAGITPRIVSVPVGCQIPCYFRDCDYRVCMDLIEPEDVFQKTADWLQTTESI